MRSLVITWIATNAVLQSQTAQLNKDLEDKLSELERGRNRRWMKRSAALQANFDHLTGTLLSNALTPFTHSSASIRSKSWRSVSEWPGVVTFRPRKSGSWSQAPRLHDIGLIGFERSRCCIGFCDPGIPDRRRSQVTPTASGVRTGPCYLCRSAEGVGRNDPRASRTFRWPRLSRRLGGRDDSATRALSRSRSALCRMWCPAKTLPCKGILPDSPGLLRSGGGSSLLSARCRRVSPRTMREVLVEELSPGMKLATGIYSQGRTTPDGGRPGVESSFDRERSRTTTCALQ